MGGKEGVCFMEDRRIEIEALELAVGREGHSLVMLLQK
jgi:hypothetical protein